MKQKSLKQLTKKVNDFNTKYSIGDSLNLILDSDEVKTVTVKAPASVLGGHSAVGWFNEISGCYSLDNVIK